MSRRELFGKGSAPSLHALRRPKFLKSNDDIPNRIAQQRNRPAHAATGKLKSGKLNKVTERQIGVQSAYNPNVPRNGAIFLQGQMESAFRCTIENFSEQGAILNLDDTAQVPGEFSIAFDDYPGEKLICRMAWQSPKKLRVKFVTAGTNNKAG